MKTVILSLLVLGFSLSSQATIYECKTKENPKLIPIFNTVDKTVHFTYPNGRGGTDAQYVACNTGKAEPGRRPSLLVCQIVTGIDSKTKQATSGFVVSLNLGRDKMYTSITQWDAGGRGSVRLDCEELLLKKQ